MKTSRSGFTLIEVLVVIAILAIIGAGAVSVANNVVKKAKISKTQGAIINLVTALEEYSRETGSFPNTSNIAIMYGIMEANPKTSFILEKLSDEFVIQNPSPDADPATPDTVTLVDSWGNIMRLQNIGGGNFPKITSSGPDEQLDTSDDIISTNQ